MWRRKLSAINRCAREMCPHENLHKSYQLVGRFLPTFSHAHLKVPHGYFFMRLKGHDGKTFFYCVSVAWKAKKHKKFLTQI